MISKRIDFKNQSGNDLSAILEMPVDQNPSAFAVFAHCFTCGKDLTAVRNISRALNTHNIAVLRFDFTGLGQSEGEFADTNFSSTVDDIISAAEFLTQEYQAPEVIIGHSLGGTASIMAANRMESVKAVAVIGSPSEAVHVGHLLVEKMDQINQQGFATVNIGGRPFTIKKQFLDDLEKTNIKSVLKEMRKALLILHSPQDNIVDISNAAEIYDAAFHPKSFISMDRADHLLSDKDDSVYVGNMIGSWLQRYLRIEPVEDLETDLQAVVLTGPSGYTTEVKAGHHRFLADEPLSVGGNDLGPNPYDLLVAALGTCTSMTLRMYSDRKKWDVRQIKVHLQHDKIHVTDSGDPEKKNNRIDKIDRRIEVTGDLSQEQVGRLLEIADRCPVHRTLHGEIQVQSSIDHI